MKIIIYIVSTFCLLGCNCKNCNEVTGNLKRDDPVVKDVEIAVGEGVEESISSSEGIGEGVDVSGDEDVGVGEGVSESVGDGVGVGVGVGVCVGVGSDDGDGVPVDFKAGERAVTRVANSTFTFT